MPKSRCGCLEDVWVKEGLKIRLYWSVTKSGNSHIPNPGASSRLKAIYHAEPKK